MSGVKELRLWQEAVALAGEVVRAARPWARDHRALGVATMEGAVAVACGIAAGYGTYSTLDQLAAYRSAERSLAELDTRLAVARHAGLLSAAALAQLTTRSQVVARLLAGYVGYVERQIGAASASASAAPAEGAAADAGGA